MLQALDQSDDDHDAKAEDDSPAAFIQQRAKKVVEGVLRDDVGFARAVKAMVAHTIKEYRGRFLHELIQNGYDAHSNGDSDGKVAIFFDEKEGPHGVLYVANGGRPLSQSNFERMATLGESDKIIGEGIGNKGVGFKSVFQICDIPEIYSAYDLNDPAFSGYSFRLGTRSDLVDLLDGDEQRVQAVEKNLSLSMLTIPLFDVPEHALSFRRQGYVTVLRLAASSARAASEIQERIDRLLSSAAPIMLFLDRLSSMSIQPSTSSEVRTLTRESFAGSIGTRVVLNDDICYRVFSCTIPRERLMTALQASVDEGALDKRWLEWETEAAVSVAIGDGWEVPDPHAFTYLPMGQGAQAPLVGHVNGPFVTDFARLGLDVEQPVNQMLLESAAELCVRSAQQLINANEDANSVVDLVGWNVSELSFIEAACQRLQAQSLIDAIRLPCLGSGWETLRDAYLWPKTACEVIRPAVIAELTNVHFVDEARVALSRLTKIAETVANFGVTLNPTPEALAKWVEDFAANLARTKAKPPQWRLFYDDLAQLFSSGDLLRDRKLLLSADGSLVASDEQMHHKKSGKSRGPSRAVFFAPRATGTDDDDAVDSDLDILPPRSLKQRLVFMQRDLEWYEGPQRTRGRAFLQENGLVRQFRTAGLLSHLGQVMSEPTTVRVKKEALNFAYRLFANNPTKHSKELAAVGLAVPNMHGTWIAANTARFSKNWDTPGADDLSLLAALPVETYPALSNLSAALLPEPEFFDRSAKQLDRWREFLRVIGVRTSLPVQECSEPRTINGRNLTVDFLPSVSVPAAVPEGVATVWRSVLPETGNMNHPDTPFQTTDPICWFSGQDEVSTLPNRERLAYARLVARTLPTLESNHLRSTWRRYRGGGWHSVIPSPLSAFLKQAPWMPLVQPGSAERTFAMPSEVWFIGQDDLMAASYSPVLDPSLRGLLGAGVGVARATEEVGFRNWGHQRDAPQLIDHLTELLAAGDIPDTAFEHFRTTMASAWSQVGDPKFRWQPHLGRGVTVDRAGHLSVSVPEQSLGEPLFVTSPDDKSTTTRLIRELAWPTIDVDSAEAAVLDEVAGVLDKQWPTEVHVASGWQLDVLSNGEPWSPLSDSVRLVDEIKWLPLLVACTMRFPRAPALRAGKQIPRTLDELSRISLSASDLITIVTPAGQQRLPRRLRGVLPMPGTAPTLLAEGLVSPPTWASLEVLAEAALELLGQSRFSAELSLNLRKLSGGESDISCWPEDLEISEALGIPLRSVSETRAMVVGSLSGLVERLSHVAPCLVRPESATTIRPENPDLLSMEGVRSALASLFGGDVLAGAELLKAAEETASSDELRLKLGIGLKDFNNALHTYFPGVRPVDYSEQFAQEFALRKSVRRTELINTARSSRYSQFKNFETQEDWPSIRALSFLTPVPSWGQTIDILSDAVADERINTLMAAEFQPPDNVPELVSWDDVREQNGRRLQDRLQFAGGIIKAWCACQRQVFNPAWSENSYEETIHRSFDMVGALDFEVLDDSRLIKWLQVFELWPPSMDPTLEPIRLGLKNEDIELQESVAAIARQAALRKLRQVSLHGHLVDLDESMSAVVDGIQGILKGDSGSLRVPYQNARLRRVSAPSPRSAKASTSGLARQIPERMSDAQRQAVGLAGEMIAYRWLQDRDPGQVDERCWKSSNARFVFTGQAGDDGLGYDFEVPRKTGNVFYEVKATQGIAATIELGETEVRCAQEFARTDRWRLLIVEEALSTSPRIRMLPNPFRSDSRDFFRFVGNSVRLRFTLDS